MVVVVYPISSPSAAANNSLARINTNTRLLHIVAALCPPLLIYIRRHSTSSPTFDYPLPILSPITIMPSAESEVSLLLIKPDATAVAPSILSMLNATPLTIEHNASLTLTASTLNTLFPNQPQQLKDHLLSGPCTALILRAPDAVAQLRTLAGPMDPAEAKTSAPRSIRATYGSDTVKNAVHVSFSAKDAIREISVLFPTWQGAKSSDTKDYLRQNVVPVLTDALTEMCTVMPQNPVRWLADYLVKSEKRKKVYFVLGGPGAGKGTQCARLVEKYSFDHFSAGDLLRKEVASGTEQGEMIGDMIKNGKIVPGHITIALLKQAIDGSSAPGVLIDGFPRQLDQAGAFEKQVSDFEFVLFFDCPEEEMERRLLERGKTSGRSDDNLNSIRKRFRTFIETSMPVIEYYEAKGKVHRIDATRPIDQVTESVLKLF